MGVWSAYSPGIISCAPRPSVPRSLARALDRDALLAGVRLLLASAIEDQTGRGQRVAQRDAQVLRVVVLLIAAHSSPTRSLFCCHSSLACCYVPRGYSLGNAGLIGAIAWG